MNSQQAQAAIQQTKGLRVSDQGNLFDAQLVRSFIHHALEHPATREPLEGILLQHITAGHHHPSVIAATLRPIIDDVLSATNARDWAFVCAELIGEAIDELRWHEHDKDRRGPR